MHDVELVLFDLDNTLFDYDHCWESGFKATFAEHGLTRGLDAESLYKTFLKHDALLWKEFTSGLLSLHEVRVKRFVATMAELGVVVSEEESVDFHELFRTLHIEYVNPDPVVTQVIAELFSQYRLGIITNGGTEQWSKVSKLGLAPYFPPNTIFASDVIGCAKPNKRIFDLALHHFNVKPEKAVFVGDSWEHDVVGSLNAGLPCVWLNRRNHKAPTDHKPLATIERLSELPMLLTHSPPTSDNSEVT